MLSAVIENDLQVETVSWGFVAANKGASYVELTRKLTADELGRIQDKCNAVIEQDALVRVRVAQGQRAESMPADYIHEQGVMRTVEIDGLNDANACCGTHAPSTGLLRAIFLLPAQTSIARGSGTPNARLFFIAGERVVRECTRAHTAAREAAQALGGLSAHEEVGPRLREVLAKQMDMAKRERKLREALARRIARTLTGGNGEVQRLAWTAQDEHADDLDVCDSAEMLAALQGHVTPPGAYVLALAAGGAVAVTGSDEALVKSASAKLQEGAKAAGLQIKGGGKGPRWQGKLAGGAHPSLSSLVHACVH